MKRSLYVLMMTLAALGAAQAAETDYPPVLTAAESAPPPVQTELRPMRPVRTVATEGELVDVTPTLSAIPLSRAQVDEERRAARAAGRLDNGELDPSAGR